MVANKSDIEADADNIFEELKKRTELPCFLASTKHGVGLGDIIVKLREVILAEKERQE